MKQNKIKKLYENGECPDCGDMIPNNVVEGDACAGCGHVFYEQHPDDDDAPVFIVDLPDMEVNGNWTEVARFDTKQEAIAYCRREFKADSKGRINLITEVM